MGKEEATVVLTDDGTGWLQWTAVIEHDGIKGVSSYHSTRWGATWSAKSDWKKKRRNANRPKKQKSYKHTEERTVLL